MKFELVPIGDFKPLGEAFLTGLVFALFNWFMLGAGPLFAFLPIKLSKSMLMFPASLHVEPKAIGFFDGSGGTLLLLELLLVVLDGNRMLSARKDKTRLVKLTDFQVKTWQIRKFLVEFVQIS